MDNQIVVTLISTSGAVIVGICGLWFNSNQIGKRIDDLTRRFERLEDSFNSFKDTVNGKFRDLDLEIARLMDKSK